MKFRFAILSSVLLTTIISACTPNQITTSSPNPSISIASEETQEVDPPASPNPTATSSITQASTAVQQQQITPTPKSQNTSLPQYTISATLNYAQHHLSVEEQIDYTNNSSEALAELLLIVEPARYPGVFNLIDLTWVDGQMVTGYEREIGLLRIPLLEDLQPGEQVNLDIAYELDLPSPSPSFYGRPVPFGYSSRQTNLVDWYPFIPPYVPGEGWLAHNAGSFGEHLVYGIADFTVDIQLSDSNPDLIIAASAPAVTGDDWHHYELKSARNFSWSVSDQYVLTTTTVDSTVVLAYHFPFDNEAGEVVLSTTAESLELFNHLFGPYPRKTLSVVEADFLDGMEYDGLFFLSKGFYNLYSGSKGDYLTAIAAHETSHQWWYGSLGNDQALEPWLDESLTTYSERLYYENLYPDALDWWWTYRVYYYQPRGWVDGSIYNPEGYRAYRDAVYLNGALFIEDLRKIMGDDSFFNFIRTYATKYAGQIVTADNFFDTLLSFTQVDLTDLLEKYFEKR
jgi:hypothetical protein